MYIYIYISGIVCINMNELINHRVGVAIYVLTKGLTKRKKNGVINILFGCPTLSSAVWGIYKYV